jgi:hypothetical protein
MHIETLFEVANGITEVTTDEQETALDELLDELRKARKEADSERAAEKKPHDDAASAVQAKWKPLLNRCDLATSEVKARLTPYRTAKLEAKNKAAQKAREEAEAKLKAAQEAIRSDDLEARFQGEIELKAATKLATTANKLERQATGLRTYQAAEVTDRRALLEHVMRTDPDALTDWLAEYARKALPAQLPGVTIRIERKAA